MAELNVSTKSSGRNSLKKLSPRIDLTAMVDLAFLLITFFMLTTTLSKPHLMRVAMPVDGPSTAMPETRTMTLCLGKDDRVLWYLGMADKPIITPTLVNNGMGLRAAIINTSKRVLSISGKPLIVIVKPSAHAIYSNFVSALDGLNITNTPSYAVAKISTKDIDLLKQYKAY